MHDNDPLSTMRGLVYGCIFALIFWALVAMTIYFLLI